MFFKNYFFTQNNSFLTGLVHFVFHENLMCKSGIFMVHQFCVIEFILTEIITFTEQKYSKNLS